MGTRAVRLLAAALLAAGLAACESVSQKEDPLASNIIDEASLNDLMLSVSDPNSAVDYFRKALADEPDRADFRRGLAHSLVRAENYTEAARVFQELITLGQDRPSDRIEYAMVTIRLDRWDDVRTLVSTFPAGLETPRRYMIEAMVADQDENWEAADAAYAKAVEISSQPASMLNNWGVSQMARGDLQAAKETFERAISYDQGLFNPKNNLVLVRGLEGDFSLPLVPMSDEERAVLLNNLGIIAMRQGEDRIARGLFAAAVDAHPKHYASAADKLAALESTVEY